MTRAPRPHAATAGRVNHRAGRTAASGLALAGLGFVGAGLVPGPGPRVVDAGLQLGPVYLPPVLAATVILTLAAWSWRTRSPRAIVVVGLVALVLLLGSATLGREAIAYRLTHLTDLLPFLTDTCQLLGELTALGAAAVHAATTQR